MKSEFNNRNMGMVGVPYMDGFLLELFNDLAEPSWKVWLDLDLLLYRSMGHEFRP